MCWWKYCITWIYLCRSTQMESRFNSIFSGFNFRETTVSCVPLTILRQVEFALVIDDGQTQLTQPPDTTQQVARQSRVFCEVDDALKSDAKGLDRDLVTMGL